MVVGEKWCGFVSRSLESLVSILRNPSPVFMSWLSWFRVVLSLPFDILTCLVKFLVKSFLCRFCFYMTYMNRVFHEIVIFTYLKKKKHILVKSGAFSIGIGNIGCWFGKQLVIELKLCMFYFSSAFGCCYFSCYLLTWKIRVRWTLPFVGLWVWRK